MVANRKTSNSTAHQSTANPSNLEELTSKIPGWGADLDPNNRPAVPKEKSPANGTGAHWTEPEQQVPYVKIHKSPEHRNLTPVFGTSCPPKGLSGIFRDWAYRYSEGRNLHWLGLFLADRVDVLENRIKDLIRGRPFNPVTESGVLSEWKLKGIRTRLGYRRADLKRYQNQLLLALGVIAGGWFLIRKRKSRVARK